MADQTGTDVGCLVVGEYIDEAEPPSQLPSHPGEIMRPKVVANYPDVWSGGDQVKEFTVLLKDGRTVAVRGHGLKHWPATVAGESGAYGVVLRTVSEEVVVALFKVLEVIGIFHGEVRSDRRIA